MKFLFLDVAPSLVVAFYVAAIALFHVCSSHFHPACSDLYRLLVGPSEKVMVAGWLLLGFTTGMTMAMIVRIVLKPAHVRWADRLLKLLGILAIPATWHVAMSSGRTGYELYLAIILTTLAAAVYGVWLLGFMINRAAFALDSRRTKAASS